MSIKGTWIFRQTLYFPNWTSKFYGMNYTSNGVTYNTISVYGISLRTMWYENPTNKPVYNNGVWADDADRTIIIYNELEDMTSLYPDTVPVSAFYDWLQANAVKMGDVPDPDDPSTPTVYPEITPQTPTTTSSPRTGFNRLYALTRGQLSDVLSYMSTSTFVDDLLLLFTTPIEYVNNIRAYPFDVKLNHPVGGSADERISIGTLQTPENVVGYYLGNIADPLFDLGTVDITPRFNNFLDYAPYTKIELYLPYIGVVELDTNVVMGRTLSVKYAVDYLSGKCTAFVTADNALVLQRDGTIGVEIQVGASNSADIARNLLNVGIGAVGSAVSLGTALKSGDGTALTLSAKYLAGTATNAVQAGQVHISKGGTNQPALSFYSPQKCYMIFTRPRVNVPASYAANVGIPSGKTELLSDLTGYTVVDSVHVEGITNGTQDEVTEIERLLKSGVIL